VGFRDYYRQFDDIDEAALNLERRERRRQEKAAALARAPDIDLSGTEWPDLPHSEIVNAAIARARGFVQRYPDRHATTVRRLLADRHGLSPDQIALGNGAAELLHSAALGLLSQGDELVTPWPSYPLYPLMAAHAGATPVPVEDGDIPSRSPNGPARSSSATRMTRRASTRAPRSSARCSPRCRSTCTCSPTRR
jgi:histidinol-phosphate aminotransferase